MRYAHMVRKYDSTLPNDYHNKPVRKFTPLSKQAVTVALDFRSLLRSLRSPRLVLFLIFSPFLFALFALVARPNKSHPSTTVTESVPQSFEKYGYEQIRAGTSFKPVDSRAPIQLQQYQNVVAGKRKSKVDPQKGISLIAACKDRKESLTLALASWEGVKEIDEIVIVDWGSHALDWQKLPLLQSLVRTGRVSLVLVQNPGDWVLTRAYNLAATVASGKFLLKVDCDTHLKDNFVQAHPPPEQGKYYSLGWGTERSENEGRLRGVWFASRSDFEKVGGYDERIVSYGYEEIDLYDRFDNKAGLEAKYLVLDALQHSVAADIVWTHPERNGTSHEISTRMNQKIIESLPGWTDVASKGERMQYTFTYGSNNGCLYATIDKTVTNARELKTAKERKEIEREVLEKGLHDKFNIPWDILPSLTHEDLEYLADYLDGEDEKHLVVVSLNGVDALSNMFNLVSAVVVGMSLQRPVVVIWGSSNAEMTFEQEDGAVIQQLFDLESTNELLKQATESETGKKHSMSVATRLIGAKSWPCVEELSDCGEKYDGAYKSFAEVKLDIRHSYDETDRVPLSLRKHGFMRLTNKTRIGSEEVRALAFKSLVQSHMVREVQKIFAEGAKVGIVSDWSMGSGALTEEIRKKYGDAVGPEKDEMVPIVGPHQYSIRRELYGGERSGGFCEWKKCNMGQVAREVGNVLALCSAEKVDPRVDIADKEGWANRRDVVKMMAADLRVLHGMY